MNFFVRKRKKLFIFSILLLASVIVFGLGLKYLPIHKIFSVQSSPENVFTVNPQNGQQAPHSLLIDFEVAPGKTPPDGLYKGMAHSGIYSSKAFGKNSYSAAIERTFSEIGIPDPESVGWSSWIYVFPTEREVKATFVLSVANELGVNVLWKGIGLSGPGIPQGKWFKISTNTSLSGIKFKPSYKVQIYLWNDSSTDILVDDYYVVFNGTSERRGDSTLVDMTRNIPFTPAFNRPPFRTSLLEKEQINNQNSRFLVLNQSIKEGNIKPDEMIIAGNFQGRTGATDEILVLGKDGKPGLFAFCPDEKRFIKITINISSEVSPFLYARNLWKGRFIRETGDQVLIEGEKEWILGKFEMAKDPCNQSDNPVADFRILWRSAIPDLKILPQNDVKSLHTGDFDGDQITELLISKPDGSWRMIRLSAGSGGSFTSVAEGSVVADWNRDNGKFTITPGRFLNRLKQDVILTVFINKETGKPDYSLLRFSLGRAIFETLFTLPVNNPGKTVGPDSLQVSD
ncbi:MAG: hypothetical protein WCO93_06440, partial [bacterium]